MRTALAGAVAATLTCAAVPAAAQVIRDDFAGRGISAERWLFCERDENEVAVVQPPGVPFRAAEMTVRPRVEVAVFGMMFRHPGCRNGGGAFEPEKNDERSELWEADAVTLPFGTEVWYRFAFQVDPDTPRSAERLVIGQWKQSNSATGDSPVIAQRFNGRTFSITVEQDNTSPDRAPEDKECRVWIAVDRSAVKVAGGSEAHSLLSVAGTGEPLHRPGGLPSIGHDEFEVSHAAPPATAAAAPRPCVQDLTVMPLGFLPDPFGHWVTMLYHIRLNGPDSLVEVWADGQPVARALGRIGFSTTGPGRQYFKFGPYRKHQPYPAWARLAQYARGFSREDVDR